MGNFVLRPKINPANLSANLFDILAGKLFRRRKHRGKDPLYSLAIFTYDQLWRMLTELDRRS